VQGSNFASFLIGAMDGAADVANGQYATGDFPIALSAKYAALYTQNDWKVNNRLTINLACAGTTPETCASASIASPSFDFNKLNITGTPGRYTFVNFEGNGPGRKDDSWKDFGPRRRLRLASL